MEMTHPFVRHIRSLLEAGDVTAARALIDQYQESGVNAEGLRYYRAIVEMVCQDLSGARRFLQEELVRYPENEAARNLYSLIQEKDAGREPVDDASRYAQEKKHLTRSKGRLRVVHLCFQDYGGAGNAAYRLHRALNECGVDSTMLVLNKQSHDPKVKIIPDDFGTPVGDQVTSGAQLWQGLAARWNSVISRYPRRPQGLEIFTDCRSEIDLSVLPDIRSADVIHLHWVDGMVDMQRFPAWVQGKPVIWTLHDTSAFTGGCHYTDGCERYRESCGLCPQLGTDQDNDPSRDTFAVKSAAYPRLDLTVVSPSHWMAECARNSTLFSGTPVHVLPNSVPTDIFRPLDKAESRRLLGLPEGKQIILFGSDSITNRRKGFYKLLEAVTILASQPIGENIALACFGRQEEEISWPSGLPVYTYGNVEQEARVVQLYNAADVVVIPSIEDNLPNIALESMACGTPVAAFRCGGLPDIIESGVNGAIAPGKNPADLATAIVQVLTRNEALPDTCRDIALERYSPSVQAGAYAGLYRRLCESDRSKDRAGLDWQTEKSNVEKGNEEANTNDPSRGNPDSLIAKGEQLFETGDVASALSQFTRAHALDPENAEIYNNIAVCHWQLGNPSQALLYLAEGLKRKPDDWNLVLNGGQILASCSRFDEARSLFESWLADHPDDHEARQKLAKLEGPGNEPKMGESSATGQNILVSAIVSAYNSEQYLAACIEDLEAQTIADRLEVIVVDSGSPQNERAIVESLQARYSNIRYIDSEQRETIYAAWNRGIKLARGKYITNANTDDAHHPEALEKLVAALEQDPEADLAYAHCAWTSEPNDRTGASAYRLVEYPPYNPALGMLYCLLGPHPVWRRSVFEKIGCFNPEYRAAGDLEFQMRFIRAGLKGVLVPEVLSLFYQNQDGLTLGSSVSEQEAQTINQHYRRDMPIQRLYPVSESDAQAASVSWTTQGDLAAEYECPWNDSPDRDVDYAMQCYQQALQLRPDNRNALRGLVELLGNIGAWDECDRIIATVPEFFEQDIVSAVRSRQVTALHPSEDVGLTTPVVCDAKRDLHDVTGAPDKTSIVRHELTDSFGFNVIGYVSGNLGLGVAARHLIQSLLDKGYPVSVLDLDPGQGRTGYDHQFRQYYADSPEQLPYSINLFTLSPACLSSIWPRFGHRFRKPGRMQVAFSMWELPILPPQWISILEEFDVRVAESEFIRYTFDFNLAKGRTLFSHHPIYVPDVQPVERASLGIPKEGVVFMSAFEPFSDPMRKNPESVVRAFMQGVGNNENAHLVIKINNASSNGELHPAVFQLQEQTSGHPRIHFIMDSLPYEQAIALYAMADVFVSLHRSEGLGLVLMEMMALGKPVIATAWSGNLTYMDHCNSCLVKYQLIPLNGSISFYSQEFLGRETVWAEPDVDDAAVWMRRLIDDSALRTSIGQAARRSAEKFQQEAEALNFAEELKQIWQQEVMSGTPDTVSAAALPGQQVVPHAKPADQKEEFFPMQPVSQAERRIVSDRIEETWTTRPAFHLITVVDAAESALLANTIDSLQDQLYPGWGLTIVSRNAAPDTIPDDLEMIEWLQCADDPLDVGMRSIRDTQSDWVALVGAGDILHSEFLTAVVDYTNRHPEWSLVYVDEDRVTEAGALVDPQFKPDFNLDLLRSTAYTGGGVLVRRAALFDAGGLQGHWRTENYDLALRILDRHGEDALGHVPRILYHGRQCDETARGDAFEAWEIQALKQHLERNRISATVTTGVVPGSYYVDYQHSDMPKVSVIVPTRDRLDLLQPCVESLLEKTTYPNFEVLVVDNQSEDPDTLVWLDAMEVGHPRVTVIRYPHAYNYSAINNLAVEQSDSEYVLLLNNDTQIVQANWLERMLAHAQRPEVGIVGARLVYPDQTVQHAGVVLGMTNVADHPHIGLPLQEAGYMNRAQLVQNYSAVTAACMLVRKSVFQEAGGLDEDNFRVLFNDVDFCLKTVELGYKIVWTPYATVVHHGSSSVAKNLTDREITRRRGEMFRMYEKWMPRLAADPAFNRNLSLVDRQISPERDLIPGWDPQFHDRLRVLGFPFDDWGCGEYRVKAPVRVLTQAAMIQSVVAPKADARRVPGLTELARMAPDVLLLQSFVHDFQMEALGQYRKLFPELFCVFELDDLKTQMPAKNPYHKTMYKDIKKRLRKALALCDRMVVTTEPLREVYRKWSQDIIVVPNYLERERWCNLVSKRRTGTRPRVGWAGAQQHHGDLELLYDVVKETAGEVEWIFFGMCPKELRACVSEFYPGVLFDRYPEKLASLNLDLAVAPLEHNKFNEAKSNLRVLEYGILGWPVIATDIFPYQDTPVAQVANNPRAWVNAIREHVHDPDAAESAGDRLRQWVLDNWILEDHLGDWLKALTPGSHEAGNRKELRQTGTGWA